MFIEATCEGDLLPGAGVSFTVGRESNATYNETISGIQAKRCVKNQTPEGYDEVTCEILFRAIEAGQKNRFTKFTLMPNRKS